MKSPPVSAKAEDDGSEVHPLLKEVKPVDIGLPDSRHAQYDTLVLPRLPVSWRKIDMPKPRRGSRKLDADLALGFPFFSYPDNANLLSFSTYPVFQGECFSSLHLHRENKECSVGIYDQRVSVLRDCLARTFVAKNSYTNARYDSLAAPGICLKRRNLRFDHSPILATTGRTTVTFFREAR